VTFLLYGAVALGGFVGAPTRYVIDRAISRRLESDLPWGTFLINVTGSLVLGFLTGLALHSGVGPLTMALWATGFCGALTTFSTFTFESLRLVETGRYWDATLYVVGSLLAGLLGAALGLAIGLAVSW
jgi:CrcB protein